jgi:hypothetical protein
MLTHHGQHRDVPEFKIHRLKETQVQKRVYRIEDVGFDIGIQGQDLELERPRAPESVHHLDRHCSCCGTHPCDRKATAILP